MKTAILFASTLICRTIDNESFNRVIDENAIGFAILICVFVISDFYNFFNNMDRN